MSALAALIERMVLASLRVDLPFAILAPVGTFVVLDFALRNVIHTREMASPNTSYPSSSSKRSFSAQ